MGLFTDSVVEDIAEGLLLGYVAYKGGEWAWKKFTFKGSLREDLVCLKHGTEARIRTGKWLEQAKGRTREGYQRALDAITLKMSDWASNALERLEKLETTGKMAPDNALKKRLVRFAACKPIPKTVLTTPEGKKAIENVEDEARQELFELTDQLQGV